MRNTLIPHSCFFTTQLMSFGSSDQYGIYRVSVVNNPPMFTPKKL